MSSPMRVDIQTDRDGSFRFIYEDQHESRCLREGMVADVPGGPTWLRRVCIFANSVGWRQGRNPAKNYIDAVFKQAGL